MTCETCKWWVITGKEHEDQMGCCTRFPPVIFGESGYADCFTGVWPETTKRTVACGEYKAIDERSDEGKAG